MKFLRWNLFACACVAFVGCRLMTNVPAVSIVKDGIANAVVIVSGDAAENEAARELSRYVEKISGAKLKIERSMKSSTARRIYISNGKAVPGFDIDLNSLKAQGFAIKTYGGNLAIIGKDSDGTEYGVNYFLEKYCGVRWFFPGTLGTVIPELKTIVISDIDEIQNPDFKMRIAGSRKNKKWQRHNLIGSSLPYFGGHSFCKHIPAEKYWKSNPEYFGVKNGTRYKPPHLDDSRERDWGGWQICTSNPKVVDLVAESCCKILKKKPSLKVVSICPNDGAGWCECRICKALDKKDGSYSDRLFVFANAVAEKVAKKYPDKYLLMFAYEDYQLPPENMKIHSNIIVWYTYSAADSFRKNFNDEQISRLKKWASLSKHMWIYEYYISECWNHFTPRFITEALGTEIKFFKKIGVEGYQTQSGRDWAINGPNYYIAAKLLWDSSLEPGGMMNEYCSKLFGPASEEMKAYFLTMENAWAKGLSKPGMPSWFGRFPDNKALEVYTEKDLKKCAGLFKKAEKKGAGDALVLERIEMFRAGLTFTDNHVAILKAMKDLAEAGVVLSYDFKVSDKAFTTEEIKSMMIKVRTLINKQFAFIESHKKNDLIGYYWLTDPGTRSGRYVPSFQRKLKLLEKYMKAYDNQGEVTIYKLPRKWKFRTDPNNLGVNEKWNKAEWANVELISVPAFWNKTEKHENYGGVAWYRASFEFTKDAIGKKVHVKFGAVDAEADVYLNGEFIGKHEYAKGSWKKSFQFDISKLVRSGKNILTVRVDGHGRNSGIWQPVSIFSPLENGNLVQNGNFSEGIKGWRWSPFRNKKGAVVENLIVDNDKGGKCVMRENPGQVTQLLFLKPGVKYKLSGLVKAEGLSDKSFADVYVNFAPGKNARIATLKASADWTSFSKEFSADKPRANITLRLTGQGKAYFDDIKLIEIK